MPPLHVKDLRHDNFSRQERKEATVVRTLRYEISSCFASDQDRKMSFLEVFPVITN